MNKAHTFTTASHRSLQHNRITDTITDFFCFLYTLQRLFRTRNHRHSRSNHVFTRRNLIAHRIHCFRIRTDKNDSFFTTTTCKLGVFR